MERLTEKISEYIQCNNNECRLSYCDRECEHYKRMVNKLAEYEDAEEQGLLLRLPCKVGNELFLSDYPTIHCRLKEYKFIGNEVAIVIDCWEWQRTCTRMLSDFGKTVFLTREKAEKALAKMKAGE